MPGQDMSSQLAEIFGTSKTASAVLAQPTAEDLEKQAQLNFFGELCARKGIDVGRLDDVQVEELYKSAMALKVAEEKTEDPKAAKEKEEKAKEKEATAKLASAEQEFQEKRAAVQKIAEAELMGRIMARAFVDEHQKLAGAMPPQFMKKDEKSDEGKGDEKEEDEKKKKKEASDRAAAVIEEAEKAKTASVVSSASGTPKLDELAALRGIELCKSAGIDETLAYNRINAVFTLGLSDSTKVASAVNADAAITVRALEFVEAAGFPVDWSKA